MMHLRYPCVRSFLNSERIPEKQVSQREIEKMRSRETASFLGMNDPVNSNVHSQKSMW